jgi:hypothetical protein
MGLVSIGPGIFVDGEGSLHVYPDLIRAHLGASAAVLPDAEIARYIQEAHRDVWGSSPVVLIVEDGAGGPLNGGFNRPGCGERDGG